MVDQALEETRKAAHKDLTEIELTLVKLRERIFYEKSVVLDEEYQQITSEEHPLIQSRYREMEEQLKEQMDGLEKWIEYRKEYIEKMYEDTLARAEMDHHVGCFLREDELLFVSVPSHNLQPTAPSHRIQGRPDGRQRILQMETGRRQTPSRRRLAPTRNPRPLFSTKATKSY